MHNASPEKAKRGDWKTKPMPSESESLKVDWVYTLEEFDHITNGFIPDSMDDKWFIFYEAPFLCLHRSWTGFCLFVARFEPLPAGMRIAEVIVNRNSNQYGLMDDSEPLPVLKKLLDYISKPDTARLMRKRAQEEAQTQRIAAVAQSMLSEEVGVIEGSRQLASLGSHSKLHDKDDFLIFRAIDSQAEVLPPAHSRQYWNEDVLKRKDQEFADYEARVKEAALEACRKLLDYSNPNKSGG